MTKLTEKIKGHIRAQFADMSGVKPDSRWDARRKRFVINSMAGVISFRPRKIAEMSRFRDIWLNKFILLKNQKPFDKKAMFSLYREIKKNEKVSYKANINTRVKGFLRAFC